VRCVNGEMGQRGGLVPPVWGVPKQVSDEDRASNGESPDSDARCLEDDDGSLSQVMLDGTEVRHQQVSHLARPTLNTSAE